MHTVVTSETVAYNNNR